MASPHRPGWYLRLWGVEKVAVAEISWQAVAFFRFNSGQLELGLHSGNLSVRMDELDEKVDTQELAAFLRSQGVRDLN